MAPNLIDFGDIFFERPVADKFVVAGAILEDAVVTDGAEE